MHEKTSVAIIVPCYNEVANVPFFESEFCEFAKLVKLNINLSLKMVLVDNNSNDGTIEKLAPFIQQNSDLLSVIKCPIQGYGAALKAGFASVSDCDLIGFCDFDNTYPLKSFLEMLQTLTEKQLDIIYGARLHKDSDISWIRRLGNNAYVHLLKFILRSNLNDVCSGMRLFKATLVGSILQLNSNDLSFSIQLTAFAVLKNWQIGEIPIMYRERIGKSKLSLVGDGFKFLYILLRMAIFKR